MDPRRGRSGAPLNLESGLWDRDSRNVVGAPPLSNRIVWRDWWIVAALIAIAVVLPVAVGAASGTLAIPRNDDWSYRGMSTRLYATGSFQFNGVSTALILGQIALAQPFLWLFHGSATAFLAFGIVASGVAVLGGYGLARRFVGRRDATISVLSLLLFPAYLAYAVSFQSDVPALACQLVCVGLGALAFGRKNVPTAWLLGSIAIGYLGSSIREFALAAPAAILVVLAVREPRRARTWLVIVGVAMACAVTLWVRVGLAVHPGGGRLTFMPVLLLSRPFITTSFVLLPVTLIAISRWRGFINRRDALAGLIVGCLAILAVFRIGTWPDDLWSGLITQAGSPDGGEMLGFRPKLFPDPIWVGIGLLASGATLVFGAVVAGIAGAYLRRARSEGRSVTGILGTPAGLLAVYVLNVALGLTAFGLLNLLLDRYLWPAIPVLAVLLLRHPKGPGEPRATRATGATPPVALVRLAVVAILALATMSAAFLLNSNAYDSARWRAGLALVDMGFSAETTDAGNEWVESHQTGVVTRSVPAPIWYETYWPEFRLCAFAAASSPVEIPGQSLLKTDEQAYKLLLFFGPAERFLYYKVNRPDCPR
jgi:hypothetical protein